MIFFHIFFKDFSKTLQNNTYKRKPFTKCLMIFLRQSTKREQFFRKIDREKNTKNLIVNNNDKIICACYLSSKCSVCRSVVNQITAGTSRTKLSTWLKTNIFKYCALFCNEVAKIHLQ